MSEEAKNKAIELVDKMNAKLPKITMGVIAQNNISKQCALIAVEDTILALKRGYLINDTPISDWQAKQFEFYEEVKNQIKSI